MNSLNTSCAISQHTAAALTGLSLRTWQRRVEQGQVARLGDGKALVPFAALLPELVVPLAEADLALLQRADQGSATALAELGALCALHALGVPAAAVAVPNAMNDGARKGGAAAAARYFLEQAAQQGEADAMHWLALLHAAGLAGTGDGDALALMWLARAAAQGHVIAKAQLAGLMPGAGAEAPAGGG